jgi:hypothetical protein
MVIGTALMAMIVLLIVGVAGAGMIVATHSSVATAADAAALAAAPVTFRPFGATGSARAEAARFARANGATIVSCRCRQDPMWSVRTVAVTVERLVRTPWGQTLRIRATSRATFDPTALLVIPHPDGKK